MGRRAIVAFIFCGILNIPGYCQIDSRPIVGVANFTFDKESNYISAITEKVVEMLTKSKRFQVVDRTSHDKVIEELEFQKSEYFLDSKHTAEQGALIGADYMVTGEIRQIAVSRIKNTDGTIGGYKASLSFTIKIVEVASTLSSEAQSFESKGGMKALSPERAVDEAIRTMEEKLEDYFTNNFPVNVELVKILATKKSAATRVLIAGGKSHGLNEGDKLEVQKIELIGDKPYPNTIGFVKVEKVVSNDFAECSVLKSGSEILQAFEGAEKVMCKLVRK